MTESEVWIDDYPDTDDDAKLEKAIIDATSAPHAALVCASARQYNFNATHALRPGLRIAGVPGGFPMGEQSSSRASTVFNVNCGVGTSSFLVGTGTVFGTYFTDIAFKSSNQATQLFDHASGTLYGAVFHNLGASGLKHVMGNPTRKMLITLNAWTGAWDVTTTVHTQFTLGGSDNDLAPTSMNLGADSSNWPGAGKPLMLLDKLQKTNVGPIFFTADNGWRALIVRGDPTNPGLVFTGTRFEGRNPTDTSPGALVRHEGGVTAFRSCRFAYAMTDPTPEDGGYLHISGGDVLVDHAVIDRASSVDRTTPFIWLESGTVDVSHVQRGYKGGQWLGRPRLHNVNGTVLFKDYSIEEV